MSDDLKEYKPVKVRVIRKGNVKINHAFVYKESPDIVLILVDLKQKWVKSQGSSNTSTTKSTFIISQNKMMQEKVGKNFISPNIMIGNISLHIFLDTLCSLRLRKETIKMKFITWQEIDNHMNELKWNLFIKMIRQY